MKTKRTFLCLAVLVLTLMFLPGVVAAGLVNGGFEDDFTGWTVSGNASIQTIASLSDSFGNNLMVTPYEGDKMAAITFPAMAGMVWENSLQQSATLGAGDNYLNFVYKFWTFDEAPFDNPGFLVEINGETVFSIAAGDIGDGTVGTLDYTTGNLAGGWTGLSIPISQFYSADPGRPADILISFLAGNTGDGQYPSGVFLDGPLGTEGASLSATPLPDYQVVPIPGTLLLLGSGLICVLGLRKKSRR